MQNVLFRVVRGLAVVVAIVVVHFVIVYLFNHMRIPVPDMGPVFATIMVEPEADAESAAKNEDPAPAPKRPAPPPPAHTANQPSQQAPTP